LLSGQNECIELLQAQESMLSKKSKKGKIQITLESISGSQHEITIDLLPGKTAVDLVVNNTGLKWLDKVVKNSAKNCFIAGYGVNRRLPSPNIPIIDSSPRSDAVMSLFSTEMTLSPLTEWALDQHYEKGDRFLEILRQTFERIIPGMEFSGIDKIKRELIFKTPDGEVSLYNLSDAYQNIIGLSGDLLYRITQAFDNYEDPLNIPGILLIDEIDLHLHPLWQLVVLNSLRKLLPNFQIIATTHSPLVIAGLKRKNIIKLYRDEDQVIKSTRPEIDPQGMGYSGLLKSELFGLRSTIDIETQKLLDRRNGLYAKGIKRSDEETNEMSELSDKLSGLGFAKDFKDPYFATFTQKMAQHTEFQKDKLTPEEKKEQDAIADEIIRKILKEESNNDIH
jgi:hypothetical protein